VCGGGIGSASANVCGGGIGSATANVCGGGIGSASAEGDDRNDRVDRILCSVG
jgi:hypothetical protein